MLVSRLTDQQTKQLEAIKAKTYIKTNSEIFALLLRSYIPMCDRIKSLTDENSSLEIQLRDVKDKTKNFFYHLKELEKIE